MISEKYSQEEITNLNEIDQLLNTHNQYVTIAPGSSKVLQFIVERKIEQVEKTYNGQISKKIRFTVIESDNSNSDEEKFFEVGKRSARLIISKLKEGHTLLKIGRVGSACFHIAFEIGLSPLSLQFPLCLI
jgi:hypothetical protein